MAESTKTYYVTCPICRNELFKTEFASMEMVCPKCHNGLSIYVLGEAVMVSKKKSEDPLGQAVKKRIMAYQKIFLQKETEQAEVAEKS